jgi:hypothetical protein
VCTVALSLLECPHDPAVEKLSAALKINTTEVYPWLGFGAVADHR